MIRGVHAALMVLATALSPPLLGLALDAGLALGLIALGTAAYAVLIPLLAMRRLRATDSVM